MTNEMESREMAEISSRLRRKSRSGDSDNDHALLVNDVGHESHDAASSSHHHSWRDLKGDYGNIAVLTFLYVLQGIPLGLAGSIPMILQNRGVSYKQQAEYSFVGWPFSIKLLWAPVVDSVFLPSMGRRKTWLVPVQYLLGFCMITYSFFVESHLGESPSHHPNVGMLTVMFFGLNFLAATQDIAVDGWALTMLHRRNVGYASTCNSVGQTAGYFLGSVVFMALESAEFCNTYVRSVPQSQGLMKLSDFLYFWGFVFVITTTLVWIFKREKEESAVPGEAHEGGVWDTYKTLLKILKLPIVRTAAAFLLTAKVGFAASDAVTGLKLVGSGVPREKLALLAVPLVPMQIVLPVIISRYTAGPKPMSVLLKAMPFRLAFGLVFAAIVWITPWFQQAGKGSFAWYYYVMLLVIYMMHQVTLYSMYVAVMAFFARVSDPKVGGTYMTLLNTLTNLGGNWPATLMLWLVDNLTYKACKSPANGDVIDGVSCYEPEASEMCLGSGGRCEVTIDGYYIESAVCVVIGVLWLNLWGRKTAMRLQNHKLDAWKVR